VRIILNLCNGEVWCFLCGTNWILKYYLYALRLQRVKELRCRIGSCNCWALTQASLARLTYLIFSRKTSCLGQPHQLTKLKETGMLMVNENCTNYVFYFSTITVSFVKKSNLHLTAFIVRVIISRIIRWTSHVARMQGIRNCIAHFHSCFSLRRFYLSSRFRFFIKNCWFIVVDTGFRCSSCFIYILFYLAKISAVWWIILY
jgi:hypothetical protein